MPRMKEVTFLAQPKKIHALDELRREFSIGGINYTRSRYLEELLTYAIETRFNPLEHKKTPKLLK